MLAGDPGDSLRSGVITTLSDGDLLLTARRSVGSFSWPLLERINPTTGGVVWQHRPTVDGDRWASVRLLEGVTATYRWAGSVRYVDQTAQLESRMALTTVGVSDGAIGSEHLYACNYRAPLSSPSTNLANAVRSDGTVEVLQLGTDADGLSRPRLQLWPAVGAQQGDFAMSRLGEVGRITAHGPSTLVSIEISSDNTAATSGLVVGFASHDDRLNTRLQSCELISGSGQCPAILGSSLDQSLTLGSSAVMRLSYQITDPDFQPRQVRGGSGARGLFHLDTPYAFGDTNLGNNLAEVYLAFGGTSNGFE